MSNDFKPRRPSHEGWENEGGSLRSPSYAESLGVERVLTETFRVGGYTYTSLADAVAQARRVKKLAARL